MFQTLKKEWFSNVRADILSGIVVALALIPEALAFSIIAGVDPMVALYASFCIAVIISIAGGRPAMISAATGSMALVMVPLVHDYGLQYLLAATILTGILQFIFGLLNINQLMRFIPNSVMIGFVNSLAILIFIAQVPYFWNISSTVYIFVIATLAIIYLIPKFFRGIPAPLIAIVILTFAAIKLNLVMPTVGDLGQISKSLPTFLIPDIPFNFNTLSIIFPYSLALSIVGLMETLLTASIVDDMTETNSDKQRECCGQGIANIINGFLGGMGGCAMIGQSVINIKSGGRGRLSTFVAGIFLMFLIMVLGDLVIKIPMPVLAGIMIMVSVGTFEWSSFSYLKKAPKSDAFVMLLTVIIVVATGDLSKGVIAGVIISSILFVAKASSVRVNKQITDSQIIFQINGPLFFASLDTFINNFDFSVQNKEIILDFSQTTVWDESAAAVIDKILLKYRDNDNTVDCHGLNTSSKKLMKKLSIS